MWVLEVTHFTPTLTSYSRLNYIFCSPILVENSNSANIHLCPWSNHHIVFCNLSCIGLPSPMGTWQLNDTLLTDPTIVSQLSDHLTEYFCQNDIQEIPPATLWATHKAVMRGHLIEIATTRKRQKNKRYSLALDLE